MIINDPSLKQLNPSELEEINGGGFVLTAIGVAAGVVGASIMIAGALGYANGKGDCPPPPCTE